MAQNSEVFEIQARRTGKGASFAYRQARKIPGVIYGPKTENMNCVMDEIFVLKHSGSKHESSIFQTTSEDSKLSGLKVMLKKIDHHPKTGLPIHVDLYALDMKAKIKVNVTLEFEGEPLGVKEMGGVFQITLREVEVECDPHSIPESLKVDISGLQLNESLRVSDVPFPSGVLPMTPGDRTLCGVSPPQKEEPVETAAEGEVSPEEPAPEDKKAEE